MTTRVNVDVLLCIIAVRKHPSVRDDDTAGISCTSSVRPMSDTGCPWQRDGVGDCFDTGVVAEWGQE